MSLANRLFALSLAAIIIVLDYVSKAWVHLHLPLMDSGNGTIPIFQNVLGIQFSISHAINHGAAWGIFSNYQSILLLARIIVVIALAAYFWTSERHPSWRLPLALVLAGATGNIIDVFLYGHVVDMLHFVFWGYDYPVFNVADSAIFIGIATLLIASRTEKHASV